MSGMKPKFLDGKSLPKGYFDVPNPYNATPSCNVNLLELARYAKSIGKELIELTEEEVSKFKMI